MIQVELYHSISKLFELRFLKSRGRPLKIICPTPDIADSLRNKITTNEIFDVITVSKFISEEFRKVFPDQEIQNKAEMLLMLGTLFKKLFPDESYRTFFQAFDTFTELRGFTTDFNLIAEVLDEYPKLMSKAVTIFWSIVNQENIIDEHATYFLLSEAYRAIEHEIHEQETNITRSTNYIFWGFKHLSAGQIDLIRSVAIRNDVYVPCAHAVYEGSKDTDWIRWLAPDLKAEAFRKYKSINIARFSKNRMGEVFRGLRYRPKSIYLATQSPTFEQLNELPLGNVFFKAQVDIFEGKLVSFSKNLERFVGEKINYSELDGWIKNEKQEFRKGSIRDFRWLKVVSLFEATVNEYVNLSKNNESITYDDVKLLIHVVNLRLPRNFLIPFVDNGIEVKGIESIDTFSKDNKNIICSSSDYSPLIGREERYSDHMIDFLRIIGPVRRSEFLFQMTKYQMAELLALPESILLLESGIEEHNASWNEILDLFENKKNIIPRSVLRHNEMIGFKNIKKWDSSHRKVSATLLQSYIDCPRKFYLKYIEGLESYPFLTKEVPPSELGQIEHEIIEKFFNEEVIFSEAKHFSFVKKHLEKFLEKKNLELLEYDSCFEEILNYSANGLLVLYSIKQDYPESTFEFETMLDDREVQGRIDCLIRLPFGWGIIDFKRSGASVPSCSSVARFEKIQLLFYLNHSKQNISFVSFLNLSKCDESLGISFSTEADHLLEGIGIKPRTVDVLRYSQFEKELLIKIGRDEIFPATPVNGSVCTYCMIKNICTRRGDAIT